MFSSSGAGGPEVARNAPNLPTNIEDYLAKENLPSGYILSRTIDFCYNICSCYGRRASVTVTGAVVALRPISLLTLWISEGLTQA